MKRILAILILCSAGFLAGAQTFQEEKLDRGFAGVDTPDGFHLSWRTFPADKQDAPYDIWRSTDGAKALKISSKSIKNTGDFFDTSADLSKDNTWILKSGSKELASFSRKGAEGVPYIEIPVQKPSPRSIFRVTQRSYGTSDSYNPGDESDDYSFSASDCSVGDLDGDGELEIVLKWEPSNASTPERTGLTGVTLLDAYKMDGTLLWRIDLGHNIRSTYATTNFVVYDLDSDGKAELVCKTADGTVDGTGAVLGNPRADWRSMDEASETFGRAVIGPEFLTVFRGTDGKALDSQKFIPLRFPLDSWGGIGADDSAGVFPEKFTAGVAYLDGKNPSVFFVRGADGKTVVAAWNYRGGKLENLWKFDSSDSRWGGFSGNGNPNVAVADFDSDGCDEICVGAMTVDHDGTGLFTTRLRGGASLHAGKFVPSREGLQVFGPHDNSSEIGAFLQNPAVALFDGATGEILWSAGTAETVGRAVAADIDPRHEGAEMWVGAEPVQTRGRMGGGMMPRGPQGPMPQGGPAPGGPMPQGPGGMMPQGGPGPMMMPQEPQQQASKPYDGPLKGLYSASGEQISSETPSSCNFTVFWDADAQSELLDGTKVSKWNWEKDSTEEIFKAEGVKAVGGTKSVPCLSGDILGDWREEIVWVNSDESAIRIYMTPVAAQNRVPTLLEDRQYRLGLVWQNVGHNQPPHLSYDMQTYFNTTK